MPRGRRRRVLRLQCVDGPACAHDDGPLPVVPEGVSQRDTRPSAERHDEGGARRDDQLQQLPRRAHADRYVQLRLGHSDSACRGQARNTVTQPLSRGSVSLGRVDHPMNESDQPPTSHTHTPPHQAIENDQPLTSHTHPSSPGELHSGRIVTCYYPDTPSGRSTVSLLREAFVRGVAFRVGDSLSTPARPVVVPAVVVRASAVVVPCSRDRRARPPPRYAPRCAPRYAPGRAAPATARRHARAASPASAAYPLHCPSRATYSAIHRIVKPRRRACA